MTWDIASALAELLGAIGVIVSLLYLAVQIRQNTRQSRSNAQQAILHELGNALRAQAQNKEWAELLNRGLQGLDDLDPIEKLQFLSHVAQILRLYESAYLHHLDGTLDPRFWGGVERAIADIMAYRGMRATLALRRHHFSPEFVGFAEGLRPQASQRIFGESIGTVNTMAGGSARTS
jgi:hypothetical protein